MRFEYFASFLTVTAIQVSVSAALIPSIVDGRLVPQPAGTLQGHAALAPIIQAGHPAPDLSSGILPDAPSFRVDPNTKTSRFAGVGSIFVDPDPSDPSGFFGTGTAIDRWHVLTAAHLVASGDGKQDVLPKNALFVLNYGSDLSDIIPAAAIAVHPDYGFPIGSINDDLAILQLSRPLPAGVPVYPLADPSWLGIAKLTMVGYGTSGDGVNGYYLQPAFSVKRSGANLLEFSELDDDGGAQVEVVGWDFEFEGDPARFDLFGFPWALPNREETVLGPR